MDVRSVEDPARPAETFGEFCLQIQARQRLAAEVGSSDDPAIAHIAGKADRHAVESAERRCCTIDGADEILRSDRLGRCRHPLPLTNHVSTIIEKGSFDAGPADIDRECAKLVHGYPLAAKPSV